MEIPKSPLNVLPIYPEMDCTVSDLFHSIQDEEKYIIVDIKGNLLIEKLFPFDLVYHGQNYIAIPSNIWEKLTRGLEDHHNELNLQKYPSNLWQIYEGWEANGNDSLKRWWRQYQNIIHTDPDTIKTRETIYMMSLAILNMLTLIIQSNRKNELKILCL